MITHAGSILPQPFLAHHIDHRTADGTTYRVATEGVEILHAVGKCPRHLGRADHRRHWMPVAERFTDGHNVGCNTVQLEGPPVRPYPAEARLYLVGDAKHVACAQGRVYLVKVARRRHDLAAATDNALVDEGGRRFAKSLDCGYCFARI